MADINSGVSIDTGIQDYRDLQESNRRSFTDGFTEDELQRIQFLGSNGKWGELGLGEQLAYMQMNSPENIRARYPSSGGIEDTMEQKVPNPMEGQRTEFGESMWDPTVYGDYEYEHAQDVRANNQPGVVQLAAGTLKSGTTAAATILDTAGFIYGVGSAIYNKDVFKLWNNEIINAIQAASDYVDNELLPNYYTEYDQDHPFQLDTANFWGDKVIKNLGFMAGAYLGGGMFGRGAIGLASKIGKLTKMFEMTQNAKKMTNMFLGTFANVGTESSIEAIETKKELMQLWQSEADAQKAQAMRQLEIDMVAERGKVMVPDPSDTEGQRYIDAAELKYREGLAKINEMYDQRLKDIEEKAVKAGNLDFWLNVPVLLASDLGWVTKLYGRGFKGAIQDVQRANRAVRGSIKAGNLREAGAQAARATYNYLKGPIWEGTQEVLQAEANTTSNLYYSSQLDDMYQVMYNPDYQNKTLSWLEAATEGFRQTWTDPSALEEGFIGALSAVFGMPMFRSMHDADGNRRSPIYFQGGIFDNIREFNARRRATREAIDVLNAVNKDPKIKPYILSLTQIIAEEEKKAKAVKNNDKFDYENASVRQLVRLVNAAAQVGRLEELKGIIKEFSDISDENLEQIIKNTTANDNGVLRGPFAEYASLGSNGEIVASLGDENSKKKIIAKVKQNQKGLETLIDNYEKARQELEAKTGGTLDNESLEHAIMDEVIIKNQDERITDMHARNANAGVEVKNRIAADRAEMQRRIDEGEDPEAVAEEFGPLFRISWVDWIKKKVKGLTRDGREQESPQEEQESETPAAEGTREEQESPQDSEKRITEDVLSKLGEKAKGKKITGAQQEEYDEESEKYFYKIEYEDGSSNYKLFTAEEANVLSAAIDQHNAGIREGRSEQPTGERTEQPTGERTEQPTGERTEQRTEKEEEQKKGQQKKKVNPLKRLQEMEEALDWFLGSFTPSRSLFRSKKSKRGFRTIEVSDPKNLQKLLDVKAAFQYMHERYGKDEFETAGGEKVSYDELMRSMDDLIRLNEARTRQRDLLQEAINNPKRVHETKKKAQEESRQQAAAKDKKFIKENLSKAKDWKEYQELYRSYNKDNSALTQMALLELAKDGDPRAIKFLEKLKVRRELVLYDEPGTTEEAREDKNTLVYWLYNNDEEINQDSMLILTEQALGLNTTDGIKRYRAARILLQHALDAYEQNKKNAENINKGGQEQASGERQNGPKTSYLEGQENADSAWAFMVSMINSDFKNDPQKQLEILAEYAARFPGKAASRATQIGKMMGKARDQLAKSNEGRLDFILRNISWILQSQQKDKLVQCRNFILDYLKKNPASIEDAAIQDALRQLNERIAQLEKAEKSAGEQGNGGNQDNAGNTNQDNAPKNGSADNAPKPDPSKTVGRYHVEGDKVVDENGNQVDEVTARNVLNELKLRNQKQTGEDAGNAVDALIDEQQKIRKPDGEQREEDKHLYRVENDDKPEGEEYERMEDFERETEVIGSGYIGDDNRVPPVRRMFMNAGKLINDTIRGAVAYYSKNGTLEGFQKPDSPYLSDAVFEQIKEGIQSVINKLTNMGYELHTGLTIAHKYTETEGLRRIAGTPNVIAVNRKTGEILLLNFKTMKVHEQGITTYEDELDEKASNSVRTRREQNEYQMSGYHNLLASEFGVFSKMAVLGITLVYKQQEKEEGKMSPILEREKENGEKEQYVEVESVRFDPEPTPVDYTPHVPGVPMELIPANFKGKRKAPETPQEGEGNGGKRQPKRTLIGTKQRDGQAVEIYEEVDDMADGSRRITFTDKDGVIESVFIDPELIDSEANPKEVSRKTWVAVREIIIYPDGRIDATRINYSSMRLKSAPTSYSLKPQLARTPKPKPKVKGNAQTDIGTVIVDALNHFIETIRNSISNLKTAKAKENANKRLADAEALRDSIQDIIERIESGELEGLGLPERVLKKIKDKIQAVRTHQENIRSKEKKMSRLTDTPQGRGAKKRYQKEIEKEQEYINKAYENIVKTLKNVELKPTKRDLEEKNKSVVGENVRGKWNRAKKVEGRSDTFITPQGRRYKGHYVLVESGAATASHDVTDSFKKSEGFPLEGGQSANSRNYENDEEAQAITRKHASEYDERAVKNPVVVSKDGVVISGNGRTMSGEIAAKNGTDTQYTDYVKENAAIWGFTKKQVEGMSHPRVLFVLDEDVEYTAKTYDEFNQSETKQEDVTQRTIKLGRTMSDSLYSRIAAMLSDTATSLEELFGDDETFSRVVNMLKKDGLITDNDVKVFYDNGKPSDAGKDFIGRMLLGKAFSGDEAIIRAIVSDKGVKQALMLALPQITRNIAMGDYSLADKLKEAVHEAIKAGGSGVLSSYLTMDMFNEEDNANKSALAGLLAAAIRTSPAALRRTLEMYNRTAEKYSHDTLFEDAKSPAEIAEEVLPFLQEDLRKTYEYMQKALGNRNKPLFRTEATPYDGSSKSWDDILDALTRLAKKLHISFKVITDKSQLPEGSRARKEIEAGKPVKAWYDPNTGQIIIYKPNATDVHDTIVSLLHEAVGHFGLRALFKEKFSKTLDDIYDAMSDEIKAVIQYNMKLHGWSKQTAVEEYLSYLAENMDFSKQPSLWQQIKQFFMELFGFGNDALTDDDLRVILYNSYHNLAGDGVMVESFPSVKTEAKTEAKTETERLNEQYPGWDRQTTRTGRHVTQRGNTVGTYRRIGTWAGTHLPPNTTFLDASSGMGLGTQELRKQGFKVDDIEPFPGERKEKPTFTSYDEARGKRYDVVVSNAVLNVVPDDVRTELVKEMATMTKKSGRIIISTRSAQEIAATKQKIELDEQSKILVTDKKGNPIAYQKGFTRDELQQYVQGVLGENWVVEPANARNSGINGTAVVARRKSEVTDNSDVMRDFVRNDKTKRGTTKDGPNSIVQLHDLKLLNGRLREWERRNNGGKRLKYSELVKNHSQIFPELDEYFSKYEDENNVMAIVWAEQGVRYTLDEMEDFVKYYKHRFQKDVDSDLTDLIFKGAHIVEEHLDYERFFRDTFDIRFDHRPWIKKDGEDDIIEVGENLYNHVRISVDEMYESPWNMPDIILHELIHSFTFYAISFKKNITDKNLLKAVQDLETLYEAVNEEPSLKDEEGKPLYGITSIYEMVAELANPFFRSKLHKLNLWDKLQKFIKDIIDYLQGYAPSKKEDYTVPDKNEILKNAEYMRRDTMMKPGMEKVDERLYELLEDFIDNFDPNAYFAARSMYVAPESIGRVNRSNDKNLEYQLKYYKEPLDQDDRSGGYYDVQEHRIGRNKDAIKYANLANAYYHIFKNRDTTTEKLVNAELGDPEEDMLFRMGSKRKNEMRTRLVKKREQLRKAGDGSKLAQATDEEIEATIAAIEEIGEEYALPGKDNYPKLEAAALHWALQGTVILPEDKEKVARAVELAEKANVNPQNYNNPADIINEFSKKFKEKPVDPAKLPHLHFQKKVPNTDITIFDVEDNEDGRKDMYEVIRTHIGEDGSPWCLLQTKNGEFTDFSNRMWYERYTAHQKRVAFKNGIVIAFFASHTETKLWWDKQDRSFEKIPEVKGIKDDELHRVGTYLTYEQTGISDEEPYEVFLGSKNRGFYMKWNFLDQSPSYVRYLHTADENSYIKANIFLMQEIERKRDENGHITSIEYAAPSNSRNNLLIYFYKSQPSGFKYVYKDIVLAEVRFKNGKPEYGAERDRIDGQLIREFLYKDGLPTSIKHFNNDESIIYEMRFRDGKPSYVAKYDSEGALKEESTFMENGDVETVTTYRNNVVSKKEIYNADRSYVSISYKNNQKDSKTYFDKAGNKKRHETFYDSGQLRQAIIYNDKTTVEEDYNTDGLLTSRATYDNNNFGNSKYENFKNGHLIGYSIYDNYELKERKRWYDNGNVHEEFYADLKKGTSLDKWFNEDRTLSRTEAVKENQEEELEYSNRIYYKDGNMLYRTETVVAMSNRHILSQMNYNSNNKLQSEIIYSIMTGKPQISRLYYTNGHLWQETYFEENGFKPKYRDEYYEGGQKKSEYTNGEGTIYWDKDGKVNTLLTTSTFWNAHTPEVQQQLEAQGWTKETFDAISKEERKHALNCLGI